MIETSLFQFCLSTKKNDPLQKINTKETRLSKVTETLSQKIKAASEFCFVLATHMIFPSHHITHHLYWGNRRN